MLNTLERIPKFDFYKNIDSFIFWSITFGSQQTTNNLKAIFAKQNGNAKILPQKENNP
jgi:hypothetical protein